MIHCVYAVIHARCNIHTCVAQATWMPGLTDHNKMLEYLEMLSPEYLIENVALLGGTPNYPSQNPGWRITVDGDAFCPKHA